MRIQDRSSLSPAETQTNRSAEAQKNGRENTGSSGAVSAEGDRVELSSTLGQLAHAIAAHSTERSNRVQRLAGDYQSGRYHANAEATSRSMVTDALAPAG
jgi:anti-sigma28 factor (negative regulator of flagellin synthesis)